MCTLYKSEVSKMAKELVGFDFKWYLLKCLQTSLYKVNTDKCVSCYCATPIQYVYSASIQYAKLRVMSMSRVDAVASESGLGEV